MMDWFVIICCSAAVIGGHLIQLRAEAAVRELAALALIAPAGLGLWKMVNTTLLLRCAIIFFVVEVILVCFFAFGLTANLAWSHVIVLLYILVTVSIIPRKAQQHNRDIG